MTKKTTVYWSSFWQHCAWCQCDIQGGPKKVRHYQIVNNLS